MTTDEIKAIGVGLAQRLREARDHAGLTRADLEEASGISAPQIFRLEAGKGGRAGLNQIAALAQALGVEPGWLAYGSQADRPPWIKARDRRRAPMPE